MTVLLDLAGSGVAVPLNATTFEIRGSQARDFLHRMLSQDVKGMKEGDVRPAFLLTREGRPVALFLVWALGGRFLLTCDETAALAARATLERFVIADDVEVGPPAGYHTLLLGRQECEAPDPGRLAEFGGKDVLVARRDVGRCPAFVMVDLRPESEQRPVVSAGPDADGRIRQAFDALRIEEGVPAWGAEIDGRALPTETGPMDALSTTKGCYPGQEPVVMSMHRGHPATRLCRLSVEGAAVPAHDAALLEGDRRAGRVTTAVATLAGVRALALVRYDVAKEGAVLRLEAGPTATVTQVLV